MTRAVRLAKDSSRSAHFVQHFITPSDQFSRENTVGLSHRPPGRLGFRQKEIDAGQKCGVWSR
jgi:hypothetical protein